jgi:hypothetical protein
MAAHLGSTLSREGVMTFRDTLQAPVLMKKMSRLIDERVLAASRPLLNALGLSTTPNGRH